MVLGFEIETSTGRKLATSLDEANKSNNPYFNTMLRILATRCMMQAVYFISGTTQKTEFFHYGLAAPIYTHFTSPIRRYVFSARSSNQLHPCKLSTDTPT